MGDFSNVETLEVLRVSQKGGISGIIGQLAEVLLDWGSFTYEITSSKLTQPLCSFLRTESVWEEKI